jgi:uncharacterized membrane protein (DUF4010 family)
MFLRVVAIVAALKPSLLMLIAPTLLAATLVAAGFAISWVYWPKTDTPGHQSVDFRNPFDFWSVVGFALFLGLIIVLGRAVGETFGATARWWVRSSSELPTSMRSPCRWRASHLRP